MKYLPKARNENLVTQNLNDEALVYDTIVNKAFCLNKTSSIVWQLCDGERSIPEISRELGKTLKSSANEDLVWFALNQLKKQNLLAGAENLPDRFEGLNRREIIKRVGLASALALPVISSMVSPTSAHAASGGVCGNPQLDSCVTDIDCTGSLDGDTCTNNCCVFGSGIPGNVCIPSPTNVCPVTPPGCDPIFGC